DPAPDAVALRAEIEGGIQELSLVDGSVLTTPAPRLYTRGLEVEVSDADVIDTSVPDGFGQDVMTLHGTVEEAYLSPFVDSGLRYGGGLGWAAEHEIHLVVPLTWDRDFSSNVKELTEVVLMLPDGTELRPAQDQSWMFGSAHRRPIATFTVPASLESATVEIRPRFGPELDEDFEQVEEPLTDTLTLARGAAPPRGRPSQPQVTARADRAVARSSEGPVSAPAAGQGQGCEDADGASGPGAPGALTGSLLDGHRGDHDVLEGTVAHVGLDALDRVDDLLGVLVGHLAEHGVLALQVRGGAHGDEELRPVGAGGAAGERVAA